MAKTKDIRVRVAPKITPRGQPIVFGTRSSAAAEAAKIVRRYNDRMAALTKSFVEDFKVIADAAVKAATLGEVAEDIADATDARAVIEGVRAGTIETFPGELVGRLIAGENPVRIFREFRGMTGEQLAAKVGISRPYLTQIETGKREAMFPVMAKIARALDVSLDLLAPGPDDPSGANVSAEEMYTEDLEVIASKEGKLPPSV
nr:helix-turn-helix transcriptional regulator [uncultured Dongia sp.]